jgi:mannose-6-phosphate isomerase-like protein (cupin superfamily)
VEIVNKPWGSYTTLLDESNHKIKTLFVSAGHRLSLQSHNNRSEYWVVLDGRGIVEIDGKEHQAGLGSSFYIPCQSKHRLSADKDSHISIAEVQLGVNGGCDELDIVRYQDDYNRTNQ